VPLKLDEEIGMADVCQVPLDVVVGVSQRSIRIVQEMLVVN